MSNEKEYTREEIRTIVDKELRKANMSLNTELSINEMEGVSGGRMLVPATHEEIDRRMDIIQAILDSYGFDVAYMAALEMDCVPEVGVNIYQNPFREGKVDKVRRWMHNHLEGTKNGSDGDWVTIF